MDRVTGICVCHGISEINFHHTFLIPFKGFSRNHGFTLTQTHFFFKIHFRRITPSLLPTTARLAESLLVGALP
jgi:hypothetical protein